MQKSLKILTAIAFPLILAVNVSAKEVNEYTVNDIKAAQETNPAVTALSVPAFVPGNAMTMKVIDADIHLMPVNSKHNLISYAKTKEQFEQFKTKWLPVLEQNAFVVEKIVYDESIKSGYIQYSSANDMVIRDFIAEKMDYNARDNASINEVKEQIYKALDKAGMKPIAMLDLDMSIFRPTFRYYYLTKYNENEDKEVVIRELDLGYDDELEIVQDRLNIIRVDRGMQVFHIGSRMNYKWKIGIDEKDMAEKIVDYKNYLKEKGFEFVNLKTRKMEKEYQIGDKKYTLVTDIYFFL